VIASASGSNGQGVLPSGPPSSNVTQKQGQDAVVTAVMASQAED